ncbi:MAG: SAM-dependent methyltransferase [Endomicrobium sp.]|jgi:hypothetical protein|nr:SAM-dependent methyltransferase [Endomicrobium sp.]
MSKIKEDISMSYWKNEDDVDDYVKRCFDKLGKRKNIDYTQKSSMSYYMKEALKSSAKTKQKSNFGVPDFQIEKFKQNNTILPVIIENKFHLNRLIFKPNKDIKQDDKSISAYAVNGALYYAKNMIASGKYREVIAIGCAGDNAANVQIKVYYVYGSSEGAYKEMSNYISFDFLENQKTFNDFYKNATITEEDKHKILINSREKLQKYAKELNKLMHNHSITAPQRVLYVSGMLLSMQSLFGKDNELLKTGLIPDDLKDLQTNSGRDGVIIVNQIENYLESRDVPQDKRGLMLSEFNEIKKAPLRDKTTERDKLVEKLLNKESSVNKQIFTYIYENIYKSIDGMAGHLDIMGEMYSEFLKYALGDGKELGIVLTPPYVTKMMAQILGVDKDSKVMDLATGSAGFLISAMQIMIEQIEKEYGKGSTKANNKIEKIKKEQLLGVELNIQMFTLASTNMILRGDGSSNIKAADSFKEPPKLYRDFRADKLLLNPPFTFEENGMPFLKFGLENMKIGGKAAIIIQDSAGNGKAIKSNKEILRHNQLIASIKMPVDLFVPMAGVQTSIYIVEHTGKPHDESKQVKFIDFRNDGYKRTERGIIESDNPVQRYQDIVQIFKNGKTAKVKAAWNLEKQFVMEEIDDSGVGWNFDQHQKIDTKPTEADFMKVVSDYLAWEVKQVLTADNS